MITLTEAELESLNLGIMRVDVSGIILDVNFFGAQLFGYSPLELIGRPLSVLIPENDRERQDKSFKRAAEGPEVQEFRKYVSALHKSGNKFPLCHIVGRVTSLEGNIHFVAVLYKAIVERS